MNIAEILLKLQDIADAPLEGPTFGISLIEAYSPPKATLAKLRQGSLNKADRDGDLIWPKKLHCRVSPAGEANAALDSLNVEWATKKNRPRLLIATDGVDVVGLDTKLDDALAVEFGKLAERFDFFLPLGGAERYEASAENPADIKAAGRLAKFYDAILESNADWTAHRRVHELNLFMTRILFCMFAQSTGVFPKDLFSKTLNECTSIDGSDTQPVLQEIFDTLDIAPEARPGRAEYAKRFPYVNGGLFRERTNVPNFSRIARRILLDSAKLNWSEINPDIFGSMIQAVVKPEMRGELGLHYTSVPNIMKVLRPLFLESLEQQLEGALGNPKKLDALLSRIRSIRIFDPACGSGNFLIIAYKELCRLERRVFEALRATNTQFSLPLSEISLQNFVGIELEDFAVETAKLSLYVAQHQMNVEFKRTFGAGPPDLPLTHSGKITAENAVLVDWNEFCPVDGSRETYVVGNPPYVGTRNQTKQQKEDLKETFSDISQNFKKLDYVACWYVKALRYCSQFAGTFTFVSTNSICQGEQVAILWPILFDAGYEIAFAHSAFKWKNSAAKNAGVTCVVLSLSPTGSRQKAIYDDGIVRRVNNISPYVIDFDNTIVARRNEPLATTIEMSYGNYPADGNLLTLNADEYAALISHHPEAQPFLRRLYGAQEMLKGIERWCLWLEDDDLAAARTIAPIRDRIERVRMLRAASDEVGYQRIANRPHQFRDRQVAREHTIAVPTVSSEKREYLPVLLLDGGSILNNQAFGLYDAPIYVISILSSRMHLLWAATVGGRLDERLRYSNVLVWNTFPFSELTQQQVDALEEASWGILSQRECHPTFTVSELYDPKRMPDGLLRAHKEADELVESIYIGRVFESDRERLEHLFKRYKLLLARENVPLIARTSGQRRKMNA